MFSGLQTGITLEIERFVKGENMKNKMCNLILIFFGFFSALTFHPVWGRIASALVGITFAILLISSMNARWRFALFFVLPVICFLATTYAGHELSNWLNENSPEAVVGDIIYYFGAAGKSVVPVVKGVTEISKTGSSDSLSKLKLHHFVMLLSSVFGAFVLVVISYKDKASEICK